ncbi:ABC transporter ATP-binding protein [Aestuariirhabdus sp. LZHN29]|uniref:ABC transporter ATP-binding protein n=1 Tax=Aestuariirhabdus sp. LZHN29 TaxID=3417462 RepID=UPI003CE87256
MQRSNVLELNDVTVTYKTRLAFFRHEQFTALNKVNFVVERGETLGVIGSNGCGKSTLLKVLAGIYKPDSGSVVRHCASVSLLTLGVGFDAELSGRDNAILGSMLLGATKKQAREALAEVIEFSELGDFIDQPVKTYSSGMRARLGFSVAITMDVDLLLIDEVLGVGDAKFRQKAEDVMLRKINSKQTVVFVSHSEPQVQRLCQRAIWLDKGQVVMEGETKMVLQEYSRPNRVTIGSAV